MSSSTGLGPPKPDSDLRRVIWLTLALFLSYLCVAMSLPAISVYVTTQLGFGNALAGLAVGIAFGSTILTRGWAGRLADLRGGKYSMVRGLGVYAGAGLVCGLATLPGLSAPAAYGVLIAGRLLLGVGESLTVVGLLAWCFGTMPQRSGQVLSLVGMGLYGAFAIGSPIGIAVLDKAGFGSVMAACAAVPLIGLAMVWPVTSAAIHTGQRTSFWRVIGRIWDPGVALCLGGVGSATIGAFIPLLFLSHDWAGTELALACFGGAFVLVRVLFGSTLR